MKTKLITLFLIFSILLTSGFGCKGASKQALEAMKPVTITYWRVLDGPDDFAEIIQKYNAIHPFIKVEYRKLRLSEYEDELLNAFAEDKGPDIFSIHNTWMVKYKNKLEPMPASVTLVYPITKGTLKKEVVPELRTTAMMTVKKLKDTFVDVVYRDVVMDNNIYGLPLSVDTLALYYNRDLFNNAGLTDIPSYWNKGFQQAVKRLTKQDLKRGIIQSGISLGGNNNIERFSDILAVLMMQNGATMINDANQVTFNAPPANATNDDYIPGLEALRFYTDFSNSAKEVYCWNNELGNSLEMFMGGSLAMMLGYSYHLPIIKARAPKLNFSIVKLPQIEGSPTQVNFANYWVEVVSKKSQHKSEAWDFVQFIAKEENVKSYLDKTKKPTALISLVDKQKEDPEIGVFADQVLTAKSWYRGNNVKVAEMIMGELIDNVAKTPEAIADIINIAANKVQQTVRD
ncbi:MAG: extracellular solute-binding protein [Planctomycetes bacterium]|jgi:multiple sugar transport system substrate-binding protein|nr:extracellular solute-binding protein [Planctomycetota bacterium]